MKAFQESRPLFVCVLLLVLCIASIRSLQTDVSINASLTDREDFYYHRTFYNDSAVSISVRNCIGNGTYDIIWGIRYMECDVASVPLKIVEFMKGETNFWYYVTRYPVTQTCGEEVLPLRDESVKQWSNWVKLKPYHAYDYEYVKYDSPHETHPPKIEMEQSASDHAHPRDAMPNATFVTGKDIVTKTIRNGNYVFIVHATSLKNNISRVDIEVEFHSANGFPSRYPDSVLIFYYAVCCVYVLQTIVWFILIACNWKNTLRIHHLMSFVLIVSVLESIFDAIHHDMLNKWVDNSDYFKYYPGGLWLIFLWFRTCLRLFFVILFSLGDGVTKARLGKRLCTLVVVITVLYFALGSADIIYVRRSPEPHIDIGLILGLIYGLVLAIWIFVNLVRTIWLLYKQNDLRKMSLYICVLIAVLLYVSVSIASAAFAITQIRTPHTCLRLMGSLNKEGTFLSVTYAALVLFVFVVIRPTSSNLVFLRYKVINNTSEDNDNDDFEHYELETLDE